MVFATCVFFATLDYYLPGHNFFLNQLTLDRENRRRGKRVEVKPRVSISINKPRVSILQQLRVSNSMGDSSASSVGVGEEGMARRRNRPVRVIRRIHGSNEELVLLCDCETVTVSPLRSSSRETSR